MTARIQGQTDTDGACPSLVAFMAWMSEQKSHLEWLESEQKFSDPLI